MRFSLDLNSSTPLSVYTIVDTLPIEPFIGVGIKRINSHQNHAGIVYREDGGEAQFLDLRWHHQLHQGIAKNGYAFVLLNIHQLRIPAIVGYCRLLWEVNENGCIPYGFKLPNECFDSTTAKWLLGNSGLGLTCATFILAVLHAQRITIAKLDDWPERDADNVWRQSIISALRDNNAQKQANYLESENSGVRFRPEEVAGSAASTIYPANFQTAISLGGKILNIFDDMP